MKQKSSFLNLQIILIVAFFAAMVVNYSFSPLRESVDNDISLFLERYDLGLADQFEGVEVLKHNGVQVLRNILMFGIEEYVTFFICLFSSGRSLFADEYVAAFILYLILAGYLFLFLQSIAGRVNLEANRSLPAVHGRAFILLLDAFLIENIFGYLIKLSIYFLGKIIAFKWIAETVAAVYLKISGIVVWVTTHTGEWGSILSVVAGGALAIFAYAVLFAPLIWMFLRFAFYYLIFFALLAGIIATNYILGWGLTLPAFLSNEYGFLIFLLIYTLVWKLFEYPLVINILELFGMDTDIVEHFYSIGHIFDGADHDAE